MRKALLATCLVAGLAGFASPSGAAKTPGLFNSTETHHTDLKPFPKWTGSLDRYFKQRESVAGACTQTALNKCHIQTWNDKIESLKKLPKAKQLKQVNDFMNSYKYIVDPINWGVDDYWAIPDEFFSKYGDCEDYSIAKYLTLRRLGWPPESMRIVVLKDQNLRAMHAILVVDYKNKTWVLDNQITVVVDQKKIRHYKPVFSINEEGWWRHKPKQSAKKIDKKKALAAKMAKLKALKAKKK